MTKENIKFLNIIPNREQKLAYLSGFEDILESGQFLAGDWNKRFSELFAQQVGANYCVGVGNGYDALRLALRSLNLGPEDEVIVPAHTFIATWNAVEDVGAKLVPVDVQRDTYLLCPEALRQNITKNTKAIICVHLYGLKCDLVGLYRLADEYGLKIFEDCAQCHGTVFSDLKVKHSDRVTCWSFYPGKTIGAFGDAGAVCLSDNQLHNRIREDCNYGSDKKYVHNFVGLNSRLDEIQAMILYNKLLRSQSEYDRRRLIKDRYLQNINNKSVTIQNVYRDPDIVPHLMVVEVEDRKNFMKYMTERKIETGIHYPLPIHAQKAYTKFNSLNFPSASEIADRVVSIPIYGGLTDDDQNRIIGSINEYEVV